MNVLFPNGKFTRQNVLTIGASGHTMPRSSPAMHIHVLQNKTNLASTSTLDLAYFL